MVEEFEKALEFGLGAVAVLVASDRLYDVGGTGGDVFVDGDVGIELEFLRQVSGADAAAQGDFPGIRLRLSGEDFQQGGFPTAVAPDKADFFPGGDGKGDTVEKVLVGVGEADLVGREEGGHGGKL